MRRFSILLSGAACLVLAAAPVFAQNAPINTTRSNIKHGIAEPIPLSGTKVGIAQDTKGGTATTAPNKTSPADGASEYGAIPSGWVQRDSSQTGGVGKAPAGTECVKNHTGKGTKSTKNGCVGTVSVRLGK